MDIRRAFYSFYIKAQRRIAPGLNNSQYSYLKVLREVARPGCRWLDLGCGHQLFPPWTKTNEQDLVRPAQLVIGVDADFDSLRQHKSIGHRAMATAFHLPFRDNAFNLITANMVIEHIPEPETLMAELSRVLEPGGMLLFHTCNYDHYQVRLVSLLPQKAKNMLAYALEGRNESDVFPTFYRMNTPAVLERLARAFHFEVVRLDTMNSSAETIMLGPVVVLELLLIRMLNQPRFARWRSNIVALLEKKPA